MHTGASLYEGKCSPGFGLPQWGSHFALTPTKFGARFGAHLDQSRSHSVALVD
jgi:hypothetical protein